jgi:hypothetical protein
MADDLRTRLLALLEGTTPGPWHLCKRGDGTMVVLIRNEVGNPHRHITELCWADSEGGEPDARLIAEAPEAIRQAVAALNERDELLREAGQFISPTFSRGEELLARIRLLTNPTPEE